MCPIADATSVDSQSAHVKKGALSGCHYGGTYVMEKMKQESYAKLGEHYFSIQFDHDTDGA